MTEEKRNKDEELADTLTAIAVVAQNLARRIRQQAMSKTDKDEKSDGVLPIN